MKRLITSLIATLALTTAPAYAQSETAIAIELGRYHGVMYCVALRAGVRTSEQMIDVFSTLEDPKLDRGLEWYGYWKEIGNQGMVDTFFTSTFGYTAEHCPVLMLRYMEENN